MILKKSIRADRNLFIYSLEYDYVPAILLEKVKNFLLAVNLLFHWLVLRRSSGFMLLEKFQAAPFLKDFWEKRIQLDSKYIQKRSTYNYFLAVLLPVGVALGTGVLLVLFSLLLKKDNLVLAAYLGFMLTTVLTITAFIINIMDNKFTSFCWLNTVYDYEKFTNELMMLYCREKRLFTLELKRYYPLSYNEAVEFAHKMDSCFADEISVK